MLKCPLSLGPKDDRSTPSANTRQWRHTCLSAATALSQGSSGTRSGSRRQLASAPGLVGYALDAELMAKTFWTFSLWEDRGDLDTFARSEPHRLIISRLRPRMGETRFEFFSVSGSELPMKWDQMKAPVR